MDADACPVKKIINQAACDFDIEVIFVASYNHFSLNANGKNWLYVDTKKEAVDLKIINLTSKGDIVITQDIGLASMLLKKGVTVFSNRGERYLEEEMIVMLEGRYTRAKERRRGNHGKGPKPMSAPDYKRFKTNLYLFLTSLP